MDEMATTKETMRIMANSTGSSGFRLWECSGNVKCQLTRPLIRVLLGVLAATTLVGKFACECGKRGAPRPREVASSRPACTQQTSPEQDRRLARWINELSSKDASRREKAKAQLREVLEESPIGPATVLLRHANVVADKKEVRRECRELLVARQSPKRQDARKLAADELGLPVRRIIDIPYLPYVLNDTFLFALFNPASRTAGPTAKVYVSVSFAAAETQPVVRRHKGGVSPEELSLLLAASDFGVESAEDAIDVAVLAAGLASAEHADGWCLVPRPDTVAPCDMWPHGKTLPRDLQQKAVEASATFTGDKNAYVVRITTWAAVGGRVTNWRIQVSKGGTVKVEDREVIGGAFGIGFS